MNISKETDNHFSW